jgi:hypothetical protein
MKVSCIDLKTALKRTRDVAVVHALKLGLLVSIEASVSQHVAYRLSKFDVRICI